MTPFQAVQQHTLADLYDMVSDTTPTFTSFSSGLGTPFGDSSLLSPPGLSPMIHNNLGTSIDPTGNKNGTYIQLMQQYKLMQNELHSEKIEHNRLKYVFLFIIPR